MITGRLKRAGRSMNFLFSALVIALWIDAYIWLIRGGRYKAFLQPNLMPLLFIGVGILVILLLSFALEGESEKAHVSGKAVWVKAAILTLPIVYLYAVYGESLGTDALSKRKLGLSAGLETSAGVKGNPLPDSRFDKSITLLELVRNLDRIGGRQVITSGCVYRDSAVPDGHFMLFQFVISCCAADAQPVWVLVKSNMSGALANESWVRVEGKVVFEQYQQNRIPVIEARALKPLPTPPVGERYLYF